MNNWTKICAASLLVTCSSIASAETLKYEVTFPSTTANSFYPNLDLNQVNKLEISVERNVYQPEDRIKYLKVDFENATDLTISNLSFDENRSVYLGTVNGAWVYKQIAVELNAGPRMFADENIALRLFVVDQQSQLNNPSMSYGPELVNTGGALVNKTYNRLADRLNLKINNKNLTMKLYQRAEKVNSSFGVFEGFRIDTSWLGYGERTIVIPAPFAVSDPNFKAVGIEIESHTLPDGQVDHLVNIKYEDINGIQQTTPSESLMLLLESVYPLNS